MSIEPVNSGLAVAGATPVGFEDFNPTTDTGDGQRRLRLRVGRFDATVDGPSGPMNVQASGFVAGKDDDWEPTNELTVIILGLVKQRIKWDTEMSPANTGPICRSYDFAVGRPDLSRFDFPAFHPDTDPNALDPESPQLNCTNCVAKEWGSHPERQTAFCTEQFVFPSLLIEGGEERPVFITFQKSGLKPTKQYMNRFYRAGDPMSSVYTTIGIQEHRNNSVQYGTPTFMAGDAVDPGRAQELADLYLDGRKYLTTPPKKDAVAHATAVAVSPRSVADSLVEDAFSMEDGPGF